MDNVAAFGGGILCKPDTAPRITNCTISRNTAAGEGAGGGGIYSDYASPTISDCVISDNTATGDGVSGGGVVFIGEGSPTIINCTITANAIVGKAAEGGGIYCVVGSPTIVNCTITANTVLGSLHAAGGGMLCRNDGTITNCAIIGNTVDGPDGQGGGIACEHGSPTIANCTIAGNTASLDGGGVYCAHEVNLTITNCVLWGDAPQEIYVHSDQPVVTYSDVQGGWPGEGNIDAAPVFVNGPLGDYYLSQIAAGQPVDSPCVNAGSDTAENLGLDTRTTRTDQVGDAGIVDMGYHYPIECVGDLDDDNDTDHGDLGILLADWGCDDPANGCVGDLNGDDRTDHADLGILLADWGCGT